MSAHSFYSPSSAHRWINCPGSMTFPENLESGGSSTFADDGTASHYWSGLCLESGRDAAFYLGVDIELNGKIYTMDETRADFCQIYIDDVRRRAIGGKLFVEYKVDLSDLLGDDQGGTMDAGVILPVAKHLIGEDLKYGTGEKVFACYGEEINPQLGLYLLGLLRDARLLGYEIKTVTGVICQPRLGHIDEYTCSVAELEAFGAKAQASIARIELNPGERTCRWCRVKAKCKALAAFVAAEVKCDFETIEVEPPLVVPADTRSIGLAYLAVPLVEQWCNAVRGEVIKQVTEGKEVIGPDGKPYKFIEGEEGKRQWTDEAAAEAILVGQLGPEKAYAPRKIITAPVAGKIFDKKKTQNLWTEVFQPLIKRARGQPQLVIGSDPRPVYNNVASADDFNEDLTE
jgi:hypothetical protein